MLATRLRVSVFQGLVCVPLGAVTNVLFMSERLPERMAGFAALLALMLCTRVMLDWRVARRHVKALAVGYAAMLILCLLYLISLSPTDLSVLAVPLSALVIALPLLFPWGALTQAFLATAAMLAFAALFLQGNSEHSSTTVVNIAISFGSLDVVSVVMAGLLESQRRAVFQARWRLRGLGRRRRRIMRIGRELRSTLDVSTLLPRLLEHALDLVKADQIAILCRQPDGFSYRFNAAAGTVLYPELIGASWPADFSRDLCAAFAPKDLHVVPGGPLDPFLAESLASLGTRHALLAAAGPHPQPLAFLFWSRRIDVPFAESDRRIAQEIADQAYTALSAAELYQKAIEASRLKSEFVSTVSHEFRTPLSVIMGYAEMAQDPHVPSSERERSLAGIENSARELLLLVEHTLDIGRLEAGRSELVRENIRLRTFWKGLEEMCRLLPRKEGVQLDWRSTFPDVWIRSDQRRLGLIVRNLVSNALKFTERGSVSVEAELDGAELRLRVTDTGIGIRPEDQSAIFEIFRQVDGSDSRRYAGTGLGLYIVTQFAAQLGGSVSVTSEVGQGSRFTVTVPRAVGQLAPAPSAEREEGAEDEADERERVRSEATHAELPNGAEAWIAAPASRRARVA